MNLDINTPNGQISLNHEKEAQNWIKRKWKVEIIETLKHTAAKCDGFIVREDQCIAVFETKCRYDMTYKKLVEERGTWLISYEKILYGQQVSKILQIPFLGFLYLIPNEAPEDKVLLFWKITDSNGEFCFDFQITEQEETQKTCNKEKGTIIRPNAHLPVEYSHFV